MGELADVLEQLRRFGVVEALRAEPGIHVVGGSVRDLLLDREPRELDLVVEGDAVEVARRLGGEVVSHDRFGTATVRLDEGTVDLASSRRETYERPGALPDVELGVPIADDLARRDFTVNAMAVRLADGEATLWPGAVEDLRAGVLRILHPRSFEDDPTRLLRLVRYGARLGFAAEPETARLAEEAAVDTVTGSRLGSELRLLLLEPQPAALAGLGSLGPRVVHPAFRARPELIEAVLAEIPEDGRGDLATLASCLLGADGVEASLDRLAFTAAERDTVARAARADALAAALGDATSPSDVAAAARAEPPEALALAAALGADAARRWLAEWRHVRLDITGHDLLGAGLSGPAVGAGLDAALGARLDGRAPTREEQLRVALEERA